MKISICIPSYNQSVYLGRALRSCLVQEGVDVRVIVSDDASTDDTLQVLRAFAADERVVYARQERNIGIAGNASWAISQASTDYIVRLDSDDVLKPTFCAVLAAALEQNPAAGVAHASVAEIDQRDITTRLRLLGRSAGFQPPDEALRDGINGYRVAANLCMFRRAALPPSPVYRFGMNFAEDWDLFLRIADAGWGNVYVREVLGSYRVWSDATGKRAGRRRTEIQGIRRVFEETLEPAWERRGWSKDPLKVARSRIARAQARSLADPRISSDERQGIVNDLSLLSPEDRALSRTITLMRSPLATPLLVGSRTKLWLKDQVKRLLRRG